MTIIRMLLMAAAVLAVLVAVPAGVLDFESDHGFTKDSSGAPGSAEAGSPAEEADLAALGTGVPCRKLTQTIDIGGQTVPASAVVCREGDGTWRLNATQSAQLDPVPVSDEPPAWAAPATPSGRHCVRGGLLCGTSGSAGRVRVIAARPHYPPKGAIDRPNR
jgi:hypothetical protein